MIDTNNSDLTLKLARGLATQEGISVQHALQLIQDEFIPTKELRHAMGGPMEQSDNSVSKILEYNVSKTNDMSLESKVTSLNERRLELEEKKLGLDEDRERRKEKRDEAKDEERREERRLDREQIRVDAKIEQERLHQESSRGERQMNLMMMLSMGSGSKSSDELLKMMTKGQDSKDDMKEFYKSMIESKDTQRHHEDSFRAELTKIEADRDVELAALKQQADLDTTNAIDKVVDTMNTNFENLLTHMPKGGAGGSVELMADFKGKLDEHNNFQKTLTDAGLGALKAEGVDVDAVKKAHGIEVKKESSTLDTLIDTGKVLWDELIKPKLDESKNESGAKVPSGLESSFDAPSAGVEAQVRADVLAKQSDQLRKEEDLARTELKSVTHEHEELDQEYASVIKEIGQKAQQYGIPTDGKTVEEVSKSVSDYEAMMHLQPSQVGSSNSFYDYIGNLCKLADHYGINIDNMTVIQIEKMISAAEKDIESSLDNIPVPELEVESSEPETATEPPEPGPVTEPPEPGTVTEPLAPGTVTEPPEPGPVTEPPKPGSVTESPEPGSVTESPESKKTEKPVSGRKKRKVAKKEYTIDGKVIESAYPHGAAIKVAKSLGGTIDNPVRVEVTGPDGDVHVYDTYRERIRSGKLVPVPMVRKVTT